LYGKENFLMAFNPLKVLSDLFINEKVTMKKGLMVSGSISGSTGLYVKRDAVIEGDLDVGGVMQNAGYAQAGALQVDGILDVAGNSYLSGNVDVVGQLSVDGALYVDNAVLDTANIQNNFYVGSPQFLTAKKGGQNSASISYVYNSGKLFISPELVSGSVVAFLSSSAVDLHSVDPTIPSGTMAIDVAKSMNSVDDYLIRLREVIEF
jgi:cytoskeletal protein CcmA (bactofilin family)